MHKIVFARKTLEAIGLLEHLYLALRFFRSGVVHVALFLQMTNLLTSVRKAQQTLVADEKKHHEEQQNNHHVFTPFPHFDICPKFRKTHDIHKIGHKVTIFFASLQIFLYFCSQINIICT